MKNLIHTFCELLRRERGYVSPWLILAGDTFLSTGSSVVTSLFVDSFIAHLSREAFLAILGGSLVASALVFSVTGLNRNVIRHSTLQGTGRLGLAVLLKELLLLGLVLALGAGPAGSSLAASAALDFLLTSAVLVGSRVALLVVYDLALSARAPGKSRVLVYGTGDKSVSLKTRARSSSRFQVVGFVSAELDPGRYALSGLPVYRFADAANLGRFARKHGVSGVVYTSREDARREANGLVRAAQELGLRNLLAPPIDELGAGRPEPREIRIEDLLGREEIKINEAGIAASFSGKVVMVTGAAGSIGSELCRQLAGFGVGHLVLFDNAETPLHELRLELSRDYPGLSFTPFIGDVRQRERLRGAFEKYHPRVVFHAAAYKHVPLMEENPCEAARVNVGGSRLVADLCVEFGVDMMVMISTDKAVNPTNVMGASKRLAEIYVQGLGLALERGEVKGKTRFVTTRFGNVLGSNGSVIPYFRKQIERGGPVTVTDPRITRYFMTIPEACRLVMEAATMSSGNQIFVFDMGEPVRIVDLAERMIRLAGHVPNGDVKIEFIGLRPGEKLYEEVLSDAENTVPTGHAKIRVARVREYRLGDIRGAYDELERLALAVRVEDTVRLMKRLVPEFKSNNSRFEALDREGEITPSPAGENASRAGR